MIDQNQVQAVQRTLAENGQRIYAVLDGASIPSLRDLLSQHRVPNVCLLPGELDPELAQAAPYLAQLDAQSPLVQLFLTQGLGHHWGILAVAAAELGTLRMHFRKFLSVWDPDGKPLYFRYYDPRVLRIYLPTCNIGELRLLFGPITAYYAEAEATGGLLRFTLGPTGLGQQTLDFSKAGAPA